MKRFAACLSVLAILGLTTLTFSGRSWADKGAEDAPKAKPDKAEKKEVVCPISKKAVDPNVSVEVNGEKTLFCCDGCVKPYLAKVLRLEDKGAEKCVLSGEPASAEQFVIHRTATEVAFCCNNCQGKFLATNKLEAKDAGAEGKVCPLSGKPASADHAVNVDGEKVYFCCGNCPKAYVKKLGVAPPAKGKEVVCPISGKPAKAETAVVHVEHKKVYFCCKNCKAKYAAKNFPPAKEKKVDKEKA